MIEAELAATATTERVALGGQATFVCSVEGAGDAELTYQWQYTADGGETWRNLGWAGAKTDTLTAEATEYRARTQSYRCVVTASDGRTAESNAVAFEVAGTLSAMAEGVAAEPGEAPGASEAGPVAAPAALSIAKQPEDCREADADGWARFEVGAEGEGLAYRWEWAVATEAEPTWAPIPIKGEDGADEALGALRALGVSAEGADARELRVRAEGLPEKVRFRCVVADAAGARAESEAVAYAPEKR